MQLVGSNECFHSSSQASIYVSSDHYILFMSPQPMSSTPFLTTPTIAPVCKDSLPPPLSLYSISARPSNHVTITLAGTSINANSAPNAVKISARARPFDTLSVLIKLKHETTSDVLRRCVTISLMSAGSGDAMQVYIVVSVMGSCIMSAGLGFGVPFMCNGVPNFIR